MKNMKNELQKKEGFVFILPLLFSSPPIPIFLIVFLAMNHYILFIFLAMMTRFLNDFCVYGCSPAVVVGAWRR